MSLWSQETAVTPLEDDRYAALVSSAWNIGDNPNGGYLASIVLQAMQHRLSGLASRLTDPISLTTHFLKPGQGGVAAEIAIDVVRLGRSVATLRGTLYQAGKPCLAVMAMFADLSTAAGVEQELTIPSPDIAPLQDCIPRSGKTQGLRLPLMERVDVMLDPAFAIPGSSDKAMIQGWIRMGDGAEPNSQCLALFCDAFPPSPLTRLGMVGWVPTLELTVHVRRRPQAGWIIGRFETLDLSGGRMIESGALWDEGGNLVAQSRQIGLVMQSD